VLHFRKNEQGRVSAFPTTELERTLVMRSANFDGLCVLALESRRAREIAKLIANLGGAPLVVPSVREVPVDSNSEALEFARELAAQHIDLVIFTTGVGVKALVSAVGTVCAREKLAEYLNEVVVVARGPKPIAALRDLGVRVSLSVPEPNTWREVLAVLDQNKDAFPLAGRRVAVQEYGVANPELPKGLEQRGAIVSPVNVYQWAPPEDLTPLQNAIESIIRGDVQVLLVASSVQIRHLFQVAEGMHRQDALLQALSRVVIASIGPLTSEELRGRGLGVDIECTHPKMGILVQEAAEKGAQILRGKRGSNSAGGNSQP